ncbi:MAG: glycosyltransferase family 1 protein [Verrucomicrobiia bacterium]
MATVALNGRFSGTLRPTGTQTASFQLYDAMLRTGDGRHRWVVFADPEFPGVAEWAGLTGVELKEVPFVRMGRARAQAWEQLEFVRLAKRYGAEVAHHPMTTCPAWSPGLPAVVTLHDLNFLLHPEWFSWRFRMAYRWLALPGLRRAARVVGISERTLSLTREVLKIPERSLRLIYNGVKPLVPVKRERGGGGVPRVLCVGSLQPHKNLPRLLEACERVRREVGDLELRVVGRVQANFRLPDRLGELLQRPWVRRLGYLTEGELAAEYAEATVFCFPSLEEGFGLPVLEAMSLGTVVVTSNGSCLPEIGGPAALLADPYSVEDLAEKLGVALRWSDEERRERVEAGKAWASQFTWERAGRLYGDLFAEELG